MTLIEVTDPARSWVRFTDGMINAGWGREQILPLMSVT